jgi:hypothetical protein
MKFFLSLLGLVALLPWLQAPAQAAPPTGLTAQQAIDVSRSAIDPALQARVVSVYGTGSPAGIETWWIIYYDPSVDSHGRAVKVANGQVARTYPAEGGVVYADSLTFAPGDARGIGKALSTAEDYAAQHAIAYNQVRVLLRVTAPGEPLRWRVQLMDDGRNKGFVFVDAASGAFANYMHAGPHHTSPSTGGDSVEAHAEAAGNDIKDTFLGIGGDLQQFFTGERTVDQ